MYESLFFSMSEDQKNIELTNVVISHKKETVFKWSCDDLGAPTATKKDSLFDWQMENEGIKSIDRFGGVEELLKTLGTDPKSVGGVVIVCMCLSGVII